MSRTPPPQPPEPERPDDESDPQPAASDPPPASEDQDVEALANDRSLTLDQARALLVSEGILPPPDLGVMAREHLRGLTASLDPRAAVAVFGLAEGEPRRSMALRLGMGVATLKVFLDSTPQLRQAVEFAEMLAVAPLERELRDRALGGAADRGSIRALELYLKRHDPLYRDQASVELTIVDQARTQEREAAAEWRAMRVVSPEDGSTT